MSKMRRRERLTDFEYEALLRVLVSATEPPFSTISVLERALTDLVNREAHVRGYINWIHAHHKFDSAEHTRGPDLDEPQQPTIDQLREEAVEDEHGYKIVRQLAEDVGPGAEDRESREIYIQLIFHPDWLETRRLFKTQEPIRSTGRHVYAHLVKPEYHQAPKLQFLGDDIWHLEEGAVSHLTTGWMLAEDELEATLFREYETSKRAEKVEREIARLQEEVEELRAQARIHRQDAKRIQEEREKEGAGDAPEEAG